MLCPQMHKILSTKGKILIVPLIQSEASVKCGVAPASSPGAMLTPMVVGVLKISPSRVGGSTSLTGSEICLLTEAELVNTPAASS